MPPGIEDRAADCWEPLLAIADEAGDDWPERAREAAVYLTKAHVDDLTKGVELLAHIREAFGDADKLHTVTLLQKLCNRDKSPWMEAHYGKPLTDRGLAIRLKPYGIKSKPVRSAMWSSRAIPLATSGTPGCVTCLLAIPRETRVTGVTTLIMKTKMYRM